MINIMEDISKKLKELVFLYNLYLIKNEHPDGGKLILRKTATDLYVILIRKGEDSFEELTNELNGSAMVDFIKNLLVDIHIETTAI